MPRAAGGDSLLRCHLLVFDLDGTLIDSQQDLAQSVNATLEYLDLPALEQRRIASFVGDGAAALLSRALSAQGAASERLLAEAMPFFLEYYRAHKLDTTYVYPGVLDALASLRAAAPALPMAVLTNKPVGPSRVLCDRLGLAPYFFANYGGDSFADKKPASTGLRTLMHEASLWTGHRTDAERTVMVGDSDVDVKTARGVGALALGCSYGLAPEKLLAAKPDSLVNRAAEWPAALRALLDSTL